MSHAPFELALILKPEPRLCLGHAVLKRGVTRPLHPAGLAKKLSDKK